MQKVLIVTLWDYHNLGNRLQNYAMQQILTQLGKEAYFVAYQKKDGLAYSAKKAVNQILVFFRSPQVSFARFCRIRKTKKFTQHYTKKHCLNIGHSLKNIEEIDLLQIDFAIAGSDQVWHGWNIDSYEFDFFYLQFMPTEKRLSFAASFGYENLPEKDVEKHQRGLRGMHYIACREQSGAKIVKELTGKAVKVVLDPTMCVPRQAWKLFVTTP